ncbi:MAG: RnfABCDGE type electron transport complex subunit G [bacterium]|nr:RnfABCDGE type electron transport complex subunit G [bacterium]MDY2830038.1 RnfABCDGE type electron transport complex subunit G [Alphaproteobacteria bacterium]
MMTKNQLKELLKPVVVLTVIAVATAFVLGYVHQMTLEPIKKAKDSQELDAIAEVAGAFDNNPFAEKMIVMTKNKKHKLVMYPARKDGRLSSVAIKSYTNTGFGGRIELMTGFNVDGSIRSFKVISAHETPGLGSKVDEPKFKEQFSGFRPHKQVLKVRQDGGDIDAVTAATISSRAVLKAIARAFDAFDNFSSGNSHE